MRKISIAEAIQIARSGKSLEGVSIENLEETQIKAKDVLLLADFGVVVPEQNIYYDDNDVEYDPEFDDVTWNRLPSDISLEEQSKMVNGINTKHASGTKVINISLELEDKEISKWAIENHNKLKYLLNKFVSDLYESRKIIEK
jgi:hypothetical protein